MAQKKARKGTQRQPAPPTVERRIFFYRVDCGTDDGGQPNAYDAAACLQQINALPWNTVGRCMPVDEGYVSCWIDNHGTSQRFRLGRIRRAGLPQVENGGGRLTALAIPDSSGLAEITHMMSFPANLLGAVFNFYGPRPTSLAAYVRAKVPGAPPELKIEPLIRADIAQQLNRFETLRLLQLKIRPSYSEIVEQANDSLGSAFTAAAAAVGDELKEVELILRAGRKKSSDLGQTIKNAVRWLARRGDLRENVSHFTVSGLDQDTQTTATLDLLSDKLVTSRKIIRQDQRSRALDDASAYDAIAQAYNELRNDLEAAAATEV